MRWTACTKSSTSDGPLFKRDTQEEYCNQAVCSRLGSVGYHCSFISHALYHPHARVRAQVSDDCLIFRPATDEDCKDK
eukprot:scaffold1847_cov233-Chaetoceros_neogracile.AAC.2